MDERIYTVSEVRECTIATPLPSHIRRIVLRNVGLVRVTTPQNWIHTIEAHNTRDLTTILRQELFPALHTIIINHTTTPVSLRGVAHITRLLQITDASAVFDLGALVLCRTIMLCGVYSQFSLYGLRASQRLRSISLVQTPGCMDQLLVLAAIPSLRMIVTQYIQQDDVLSRTFRERGVTVVALEDAPPATKHLRCVCCSV